MLTLLFYVLLLLLVGAVFFFLPRSLLVPPARAVSEWLPPFLGGKALRDWAATTAEELAQKHLAGERSGETASRLATEMEDAAMHAMLPMAEPADLKRIIACPETGQERVGVSAPEALDIAAYVRKNKSKAEQKEIYELAVRNAKEIASAPPDEKPPPCALQGEDHVCCVFAHRPLRCRPLHAIAIAKEMGLNEAAPAPPQGEESDGARHEENVARGIEIGLTRALDSAGLDADVYELNSALATALESPDVAERWAKGENVFENTAR